MAGEVGGSFEKFIKNNTENLDKLAIRQIPDMRSPANHGIKIPTHKPINYFSSILKMTSILENSRHSIEPSRPLIISCKI